MREPGAKSLRPYRPLAIADLVRLGRDHDGGYVISERTCLGADVLVVLGISDDWSFEADLPRAIRAFACSAWTVPFRRRSSGGRPGRPSRARLGTEPEYRVLPQLLPYADEFTGMTIEFHECDLLWERFRESMELLQDHFAVAHVHGNNCTPLTAGIPIPRTLETSLVHRRLLEPEEERRPSSASYPRSELDRPNVPGQPDYPLDFS